MGTKEGFFSAKGVFTVRNMAVMGLLVAISAVLNIFEPRITPTFKLVNLSFIPGVITAALYGPVAGLVFGIASDTAGYFANPQGAYFPGFALSAMAANFICAMFLYRSDCGLWRIATARILVIIAVSLGMNGIWFTMFFGMTAGSFYSAARIIKNLMQYPFDVAILYMLLRIVKRISIVN